MRGFELTGAMAIALIAVTAGTAASAEMKVSGHARVRTEIHDETDFGGYRAFHLLRMRPTFTFTGTGERAFVFEPQMAQAFGSLQGTTLTSGAAVDSALGVHQAYALLPAGSFEFKLGRQALSYGDELVIGALEWSVVGRVFDAARVRYAPGEGKGFTDLFASKIAETGQSTASTGDMDFYGLYHSMSSGPTLQAFDLYVLYQRDARGDGPLATDLWSAGTRFKSDLGTVDYRVEATYQSGEFSGTRETAYQADGEVGADLSGGVRAYLGGFVASDEYRQLYSTAHKWLGTADVLGRRNLAGPKAGAAVSSGDVKIALDLHRFSRLSADAPAYALNGTTALGSGGGSKNLGTEADLTITHAIDGTLTLTGGASMFFSGDYLKSAYGEKNPVFGFAQLDFRF